jgi:hypothetical protein
LLSISDDFSAFLNNADMLSKAHGKKSNVLLDDIFIYPELKKMDESRDYETTVNSESILNDILQSPKMVIAGQNQSGKTTICKVIFRALKSKNYIPIYVFDKDLSFKGHLENKIKSAFQDQYIGMDFDELWALRKERIVPIIDNFHFAKEKERHVDYLAEFPIQIIVVDDVFGLNIKNESVVREYCHYEIKELSPSLRNRLIEKWVMLDDYADQVNNARYEVLDKTTELVNESLGKVIGSGVMPAFPFFIITVMSVNDLYGNSMDQEITSQGHCYQALIYLYLRKSGVKNDDIDTFINFLTELAFYCYKNKKRGLSQIDYEEFLVLYKESFNMPVTEEKLMKILLDTKIISQDGLGYYFFSYEYIFYYFVAKLLSEDINKNKAQIEDILLNLHTDENSYIAIFISHHSKDSNILDEITLNACELFEKFEPAKLDVKETEYLDKNLGNIVQEMLPPASRSPEYEREKRLLEQDKADEESRLAKVEAIEDDKLSVELRRSIKTVEVMGKIIKNRAGSLGKDRLKEIFKEGMEVHLRILTSYFESIQAEEKETIEYISGVIRSINEKSETEMSQEDLEKLSGVVYWNMNFYFIILLVNKVVHSLGSSKLTNIIDEVCDDVNTPMSFLVKQGVHMWYRKTLQINEIVEKVEEDTFSRTAQKVLQHMVVDHSSMHLIKHKDRQRIESKLKIATNTLIKSTN